MQASKLRRKVDKKLATVECGTDEVWGLRTPCIVEAAFTPSLTGSPEGFEESNVLNLTGTGTSTTAHTTWLWGT